LVVMVVLYVDWSGMQPLGLFLASVDNPASLLFYSDSVGYKLIPNHVYTRYDRAQYFPSPFCSVP